ncbi:lipocalin-like domain-containing protein [Roseicitreum antarcticum]|uniref:Predicted secreted hydrolase n=1 Tax=Roseicitreum antarcticum TaxID=564137 RepID=A0A1H2U1V6_9RHOB|nr:lipocalin-like domain-containing protein [Roseicitreum antarcticum]SDW50213.1 Predicted secreted hydrolase [Roseicitreum antarcticum]
MNDRWWTIGLVGLTLLVAGGATAQNGGLAQDGAGRGFAGLGDAVTGFATPDPDRALRFPQDHGAHPAYRIEWWYLTATLSGDDGQDYGVQWTLFRSALAPGDGAERDTGRSDATDGDGTGWSSPQLWMGHAGVTTASAHYSAERLARGGIGQAGVRLSPFAATIDDWEMRSTAAPQADPLDALRLAASGPDFRYDLSLVASGPLVLHGQRGYSIKSERGQASYYYSQPFYRVTGTLTLPDGPVQVSGQGWLDREWSSQPLDPDQTGWDWVSLSFEDGARLMGFQLRDRTGGSFTSGTWISPDGMPAPLPHNALRFTPVARATVAGREIPVGWRIEEATRGLDITTTPLNPQAWMGTRVPYWEGPLRFTGSHTGRGYLEMTGY